MSLPVIDFFVIHKQSQSFWSLLPYSLLSLLMLRLWSFWSTQQVQPVCSSVFSLGSVVTSVPFFQASPSLRRVGQPLWATVAGSFLVQWVHRCLHVSSWLFGLAVTSGWWSPGVAFLTFTSSVLLAMGEGLLYFCSLLSVSTFLVFAAVVSLWFSGVLVSPTLPSVGLGFLQWTVSLHLSPLLTFGDGRGGPGVLGFRGSCSSQFPSGSFSLASPFVPEGDFVTCFCLFFLYIFFYVMVSVFFLIFVQDCCYMWGHLQDENRRYPLYDLFILYRQFIWLGSYAVVWYWLLDDRHSVALPCLPHPWVDWHLLVDYSSPFVDTVVLRLCLDSLSTFFTGW